VHLSRHLKIFSDDLAIKIKYGVPQISRENRSLFFNCPPKLAEDLTTGTYYFDNPMLVLSRPASFLI